MQHQRSTEELLELSKSIRRSVIRMTGAAGSGHPGGALSAVEILITLFYGVMNHDPKNPKWEDRDRFILSKGHGCPSLYAILADFGYTPSDELMNLRKLGSIYQGHPDRRFIPALEASTGSLGQGLSFALGAALAARLDGKSYRTYVLLGDGEIQEGQVWEAAMSAAFHKIDNVVAIVDYNKAQLDGFVSDIMELEPLVEKWQGFGWHTMRIDGHDLSALREAFDQAATVKGKPSVIIADTVKGKGVSFMENVPKWHGVAPNAEEMELALKELA